MKAMILAAGYGKRMLPLTENCPKPLLTVGGRALIEHHLLHLAAAGFHEIVINTAYLGSVIETQLGDGQRYGVAIEYSREGEPKETAGAIIHALPLLGTEPFLLVNGDVYTDYNFQALAELQPDYAHVVLTNKPSYLEQGDFDLIAQQLSNAARPYTYTGIGVYNPQPFTQLTSDAPLALGPWLRENAAKGRISGELYQGQWYDVGTPQRLQELNARVSNQVR